MNVARKVFGSGPDKNARVMTACVAGVLLIAGLDYITGVEARVYSLYYLPIALAAWQISTRVGVLFAMLSTAFWLFAMSLAGPGWSVGIYALNVATQAVSFLLVSLLVSNISSRLQRERELSQTDGLTGLKNARSFREFGEFAVSSAQRSGRPFTLAYLDLDNFRKLNDTLGHEVGDQALRLVGKALSAQTRKSDVVARMGGDEFTILLPDTPEAAATLLLDRLAISIGKEMQEHEWPTTVSIGANVFLEIPDSLAVAIERADAVMYRAKRAGKNRVVVESTDARPS
jgi:diguanylate cyclase (GGDEF)-like protein